jgi:ribosomal protein S21
MIKTKTTQNKRVDKILRTNSYDLIIKIFKRLFKKKLILQNYLEKAIFKTQTME